MKKKKVVDHNKCQDGTRVYKVTYYSKHNKEFVIRYIIADDGTPYFCMSDVGKALDLAHFSNAVRNVENIHKIQKKLYVDTITRYDGHIAKQAFTHNFLSDIGLRQAIGKSRKSEAERFNQWMFGKIIPTLNNSEEKNIRWINVKDDQKLNIPGAADWGSKVYGSTYQTISEFMVSHNLRPFHYNKAEVEKSVIDYCCKRNIIIDTVKIGGSYYNTYPYSALAEVFLEYANKILSNYRKI